RLRYVPLKGGRHSRIYVDIGAYAMFGRKHPNPDTELLIRSGRQKALPRKREQKAIFSLFLHHRKSARLQDGPDTLGEFDIIERTVGTENRNGQVLRYRRIA